MKIEAGKTYLTGNGHKVRVLCTDRNDAEYPVVGVSDDGQVVEYSETGKYYADGDVNERDLVREAPETVTLYVYQDDSGTVYALDHWNGRDNIIKTIEVEL